METAKVILLYLQTLLTWPVIGGIVLLIFFRMFQQPLSDFLRRMTKGQFYGASLEASTPLEQTKEIKEGPKLQLQENLEQYIQEHPKEAIAEHLKILNWFWFEKTFNLIYGTQIRLLEHLLTKGDKGESYVNLFPFYQEFLNQSRLTNTQMTDYTGFLMGMKFVESQGEGTNLYMKITPHGINFLSYIRTNYSNSCKFKPF